MSSVISPAPTPPPLPPRADRRRKLPIPPTNIAPPAPNLVSPIVQAAQDVEHARRLLETPAVNDELDDTDKEIHRMVREKEVTQLLLRMTDWVEELSLSLQQAHKKELELESKLTVSQSNLQIVHTHTELEESPKRPGLNGSTILELGGWRRPWSKRDSRKTSDDDTSSIVEDTLTPLPKPQSPRNSGASFAGTPNPSQPGSGSSTPSRFFNFSSLTRTSSSSITSTPPLPEAILPPKPTQRERELEQQLARERESLQKVIAEKTALEGELETLSQALFEQANKMVSNSNRKLAEIEEELRIAMEEREALKSTLRVIASHGRHNDGIRHRVSVDVSPPNQVHFVTDPSTPRARSRSSSNTSSLIFDLSPTTPHPNQTAHDHEEESGDDDAAHSQSHTSPSSRSLNEEKEESVEPETDSKKEPDGSIYSQSESNSVPVHGAPKEEEPEEEPEEEELKQEEPKQEEPKQELKEEEPAAVEANERRGEAEHTEQDSLEPNEQVSDSIASPAQPSKATDEEPAPSDIVPDMASPSSVSQYTP